MGKFRKLTGEFLLLMLCANLKASTQQAFIDSAKWGINAVTIGYLPGNVHLGQAADLLKLDKAGVLSLDRFYRLGGIKTDATPTMCRIAYNKDSLFVIFRCKEKYMTYPFQSHMGTNWNRLESTPVEQDASFPDKVDLFIRPSLDQKGFYHFAVTKEGQSFAKMSHSDTYEKTHKGTYQNIVAFRSSVTYTDHEWIAVLCIPWKLLGGMPSSTIGLLPMRTRWRDGEVSSPVALGFTDRPATDLFIEASLANYPKIFQIKGTLCTLPSGIRRWQRPALVRYPTQAQVRGIAELQQSLQYPTDSTNIGSRIFLVQCWTDLLTLEGFNFGASTGSIAPEDIFPEDIRRQVNTTLARKEMREACRSLDVYLKKLDNVSKAWFADGSVGDIRKEVWKPIETVNGIEAKDSIFVLHCTAGRYSVDLHLAFPLTGGVRLWAAKQGFFQPPGLMPIHCKKIADQYRITASGNEVRLSLHPLNIIFYSEGCGADDRRGMEGNGEKEERSSQYHQGHPGSKAAQALFNIRISDIAFRFNPKGGIEAVDVHNHLSEDEAIYGFGEKYDHFDQRGNILTLWGMDDWIGNTVGLHNESYKPIPFFHSSAGYSVFVNSSYRLRADLGKANPGEYRLTLVGPIFDEYIWCTSPQNALRSYTRLTGKPFLPPKWAFEPWIGRTGRAWGGRPLYNAVAEQQRVINEFARRDIPHSAIYAEGSSADNAALYSFVAPRNIRVLSWYYPAISAGEQQRLLPEIQKGALPVLRFKDSAHSVLHDINYVDYTNPSAMELSRRWWKHRLDLGVAGSMVDFGDRVPEDAEFYNGKKGAEMHNFYGYYYHKTYSEVFRERRGDDYILFARSASPGDQAWICQFAGDHAANFSGLQGVIKGLLNLSACGFSTWGSDLGGFRGWPDPTVYMRWTQFACFSPLMRSHGRTPREPWEYGDSAEANYSHYAWVRENLLNYIYNEAIYASKTGLPLVQSLAVAFPEEKQLAGVDDEYLFGRDLLVAPVMNDGTSRTVFFPRGKWISLWDGGAVSADVGIGGDKSVDTRAGSLAPSKGVSKTSFAVSAIVPYDRIPVYLKEGSIIAVVLDSALQFGQSLQSGSGRVNALIITDPAKASQKRLQNAQSREATVRLRPIKNGCSVEMDGLTEMLYLIVYGTDIAEVSVNNTTLPLVQHKGDKIVMPGWYADRAGRRIIIRLPCAVKRAISIQYKKPS